MVVAQAPEAHARGLGHDRIPRSPLLCRPLQPHRLCHRSPRDGNPLVARYYLHAPDSAHMVLRQRRTGHAAYEQVLQLEPACHLRGLQGAGRHHIPARSPSKVGRRICPLEEHEPSGERPLLAGRRAGRHGGKYLRRTQEAVCPSDHQQLHGGQRQGFRSDFTLGKPAAESNGIRQRIPGAAAPHRRKAMEQ